LKYAVIQRVEHSKQQSHDDLGRQAIQRDQNDRRLRYPVIEAQ